MGLLDDIPARTNVRAQCEISKATAGSSDLARDLATGIRNPALYTPGDLERACRKHGLPITASMIRYHRHGECAWCTSQGITWVS